MAYDQIINSRRSGVYDDNYFRQFAEIDARMIGQEEVLTILNDEFDLYDHFLQFRYEFVRDGDVIRWKAKQELIDERLCLGDDSKEYLYFELIQRTEKMK